MAQKPGWRLQWQGWNNTTEVVGAAPEVAGCGSQIRPEPWRLYGANGGNCLCGVGGGGSFVTARKQVMMAGMTADELAGRDVQGRQGDSRFRSWCWDAGSERHGYSDGEEAW